MNSISLILIKLFKAFQDEISRRFDHPAVKRPNFEVQLEFPWDSKR
jgi:hypothetical protein